MLWNIQPNRYAHAHKVEEQLGYIFERRSYLFEALTQRSAYVGVHGVNSEQMGQQRPWNERLEFLGDAVLSMIISESLHQKGQGYSEGDMSKARSAIVCEANLARIAREKLNLGSHLIIGGSELATGGRDKASLLADALEAVIGAVYLDGGFEQVRRVIQHLFAKEINSDLMDLVDSDAKTRFQEIVQAKYQVTPTYNLVSESGPAHQKTFEIAVQVGSKVLAHGSGSTKKQAAQSAAKIALEEISSRKSL
jgi:ribonuclease-3